MAEIIKVRGVHFNWYPDQSTSHGYRCQRFIVGEYYNVDDPRIEKKVTKIIHQDSPSYGEEHYCTIWFDDGSMEKVYNLNRVFYETF